VPQHPVALDEFDHQLLALLQRDASTTLAVLG
jgi:DNA-binding Lrp family transcriptional regulator